MKRFILLGIMVLVLGFAGMAGAAPVTFNFNPLPDGSNAGAISTYMTGQYGSPVTVTGNSVYSETNGLFSTSYIESEPLLNEHKIQFNFSTVPITGLVSFDYGAWGDAFNADYSTNGTTWITFFHHDATGFLGLGTYTGSTSFTLPSGVVGLKFHDDFVGEVGMDNLLVNRVPEPATMLLLGFGLVGLAAYGRKTFKK